MLSFHGRSLGAAQVLAALYCHVRERGVQPTAAGPPRRGRAGRMVVQMSARASLFTLVRTPADRVRALLPTGHLLPEDAWRSRHRFVVTVLWLHALGLPLFGLLAGQDAFHSVVEGGAVALAAILASPERFDRVFRASVATVGLVSSSAVVVHFSGGFIEAHFHFFVMLGLITMYQSWIP